MRRAGEPPRTVPADCVTASGAISESSEPPVGWSTAASSATSALDDRLACRASRSFAVIVTGTVSGSAPTRPTTALSPSFVSVPSAWPAAPYL